MESFQLRWGVLSGLFEQQKWCAFVSAAYFYNLSEEDGAVVASNHDSNASLQPGQSDVNDSLRFEKIIS